MIPEMAEHLKPERKHHNINTKQLYNLITNRLLTNTGICTYTDDVGLIKKLETWENFYNFNRPHGAFDGKTPYEALKHTLE